MFKGGLTVYTLESRVAFGNSTVSLLHSVVAQLFIVFYISLLLAQNSHANIPTSRLDPRKYSIV